MTLIRRCIITGGSGFIGTHLIRLLLSQESLEHIIILDLIPPQLEDPRIEYIATDLRQPLDLRINHPTDVCFHLAALCKEPKYNWDDYFQTNHAGTQKLCDFAHREGIRNIIFTSTMMVYRAGDRRYQECDLTAPDTAYGISKLLAEQALERWAAADAGRRLHIIRPGVVFGHGENGNFTRLCQALQGRAFCYVGRSSTIKSCIYVKDLCTLMRALAVSPSYFDICNAAIPRPLTIKEICDTICTVCGIRRRIPTMPFRLALLAGYCGDLADSLGLQTGLHHRRIEKLYYSTDISADQMLNTGFHPKYDLLAALLDWQQECPSGQLP